MKKRWIIAGVAGGIAAYFAYGHFLYNPDDKPFLSEKLEPDNVVTIRGVAPKRAGWALRFDVGYETTESRCSYAPRAFGLFPQLDRKLPRYHTVTLSPVVQANGRYELRVAGERPNGQCGWRLAGFGFEAIAPKGAVDLLPSALKRGPHLMRVGPQLFECRESPQVPGNYGCVQADFASTAIEFSYEVLK